MVISGKLNTHLTYLFCVLKQVISEYNSFYHFDHRISREDSFHKLLKGLRGRNEEDTQRNKRDVAKTANELISGFKVPKI